jgi:hypothetical protein
MKRLVLAAALVGAAVASGSAARAKCCIKGAVVGGVAGHHGWLGAAAGCVIGRHEAKKHAREKLQQHSGEPSR